METTWSNRRRIVVWDNILFIFLGKHLIPKGAEISVNLYAIHRDPRHFENPNEFNPDNFLPDVVAQRHPHAYIPFTLGQRKCIGKVVADNKTFENARKFSDY